MTVRYTAAVDLGKTKVGVAVFADTTLKLAFTSHSLRGSSPQAVAQDIMVRLMTSLPDWAWLPLPPHFVCEWPMKYPLARIYHKNLDELYEVGYAIGQLTNGWDARYRPSAWKGNVPKAAHHRRIKRALTAEELYALRDLGHDTWDAVGIGLFHLGRTKRGGIV